MTLLVSHPVAGECDVWSLALLQLLEQGGIGLTLKAVHSRCYAQVNPVVQKILQRDEAALLGLTDADIFSTTQSLALRAADQQVLAKPLQPQVAEHRLERHDGSRFDCTVLRVALPDEAGMPQWVMGLWLDRSVERQREDQLQGALAQLEQQQQAVDQLRRQLQAYELGVHDGLYQRAYFEEQLLRESDLSAREHREFALVMIAIDQMASLVEQYGLLAQERVVQSLGRLLKANTRAMDCSAQLDEQHFAILLSGIGLATAHARMEGLRRQCLEHIVVLDGQALQFTVAMGVASYPHTAGTVEQLMTCAQQALAWAQEGGGNRVTLARIKFESRDSQ